LSKKLDREVAPKLKRGYATQASFPAKVCCVIPDLKRHCRGGACCVIPGLAYCVRLGHPDCICVNHFIFESAFILIALVLAYRDCIRFGHIDCNFVIHFVFDCTTLACIFESAFILIALVLAYRDCIRLGHLDSIFVIHFVFDCTTLACSYGRFRHSWFQFR
jgi:hypothetical protein